MAVQSIPRSLALVLAIAAILFFSTTVAADDDVSCSVDLGGLLTNCNVYITKGMPKIPPSVICCSVVKKTDVGCACKLLAGKKLPPNIDMDKVCYVASYCKNPLPPGGKCGSYTVPAKC